MASSPQPAVLRSKMAHRMPGRMLVTEMEIGVTKDYSNPSDGPPLELFARTVERFENPVHIPGRMESPKYFPWFVYLQGGPGQGCQRPQDTPWCNFILDRGYRILLLDQRGTGLSCTITAKTLASVGGPEEQAKFLKLFRADSIVRDCEAVRKLLTVLETEPARMKWSICGQSFGGFCCVTYLSAFPEGLREVFIIGGLPPLVNGPDEVYRMLRKKVFERNMVYYCKYGEDLNRVKRVAAHLLENQIVLPSGGLLSQSRLMQLGLIFGFHGGIDRVHDLIFRMSRDLNQFGFLTRPTLATFEKFSSFDDAPLYALLHEPIYAQGTASRWSAERMLKEDARFALPLQLLGPRPLLFTGEMVSRQLFHEVGELASLEETANRLAFDDTWPKLYDEAQLAKNEVPVYSITYVDDMYVHSDFAKATAAKIRGCKNVVTNSLYHDALGSHTDEVMRRLFAIRDDTID